jgi:hypothetical protein
VSAIICASRELSKRLLLESAEHLVGTCKAHVVAVPAHDVSEGLGDEGLADADGSENADVTMRFEEAQADELREHALVEGNLRGLVPELGTHRGIESGFGGAIVGGGVVAPCDLVGEDHQEQIIE